MPGSGQRVNRELSMAIEIELKFRLDGPEAVRRRLTQLGARRLSRVLEVNSLFDTAEQRLLRADCGLRLRESRPVAAASEAAPAALLTFKGPRQTGLPKTRAEFETSIGDPQALRSILEQLGLRVVMIYEKRRELWQVAECHAALDELPRLGWWLEIEGPTSEAVQAARELLWLYDVPPVAETYVEMVARCGQPDADGCCTLRFGTTDEQADG